jgi:hypothetical protein
MSNDERNALVVLREQLERAKSELARPGARNRRNSDRIRKLDEAMVAVEVLIGRPRDRARVG